MVRECGVTCRFDSERTSHVVFDGAFNNTAVKTYVGTSRKSRYCGEGIHVL